MTAPKAAIHIRECTTPTTPKNPNTTSLKPVYFLIIFLFLCYLYSFYWLYANIINLQRRYETVFWELQDQGKYWRHISPSTSSRSKRQIPLQDSSIVLKNTIVDGNETSRNDSGFTSQQQEETFNFRNYTAEDWIWLNKYSRVPIKVLEEFCKITHEKCPTQKGEQGAKGDVGERGEKGDLGGSGADGKPGPMGETGPRGPPGPKGDRGDRGEKGYSGLNGNPGIPGEPGLDGIPGRNGKDGTPGKDGSPGRDGIPGTPGRNGKDGDRGEKGDRGDPGPQGLTGLPGSRGKPGKPGADGIAGTPGISAKNCSVNGTNQLLVPPTIVGSDLKYFIENITVNEYDNVLLTCASSGAPKPINVWRRIKEDSENGDLEQLPVTQGHWAGVNWDKDKLEFMNISRKHMGQYMCIANNGIPPAANVSYQLNVHFPPYIEIDNPFLNVTVGGTARLRCKIEAYPLGVYYWEDTFGFIYEETINDSISVDYYYISSYETILEMNITNVQKDQMGFYYCIGKNKKGLTKGYINVTDEVGSELPVTDSCYKNRVKFGVEAPPIEGQICHECPQCKICGFGYRDLEIRPLSVPDNQSNTSFTRARRCQLEAIGKAVFHNSWPNQYGSWMRETYSNNQDRDETYYLTLLDNCTTCLYKFESKQAFTSKILSNKITFIDPIWGNDHVIFNGSFYYATMKDRSIYMVKYDLLSSNKVTQKLSHCETNPRNYLYKSENNFVDVMSDENGLWAVCALSGSNNTVVWKFNTTSQFVIERAWNISVKHQEFGDMFIICGILYAVDNVTAPQTKISLALDLYDGKLLDDNNYIIFQNPFSNTTMISYNYRNNELNTWDDGNMLTYPIKCQDLDSGKPTNETSHTVTELKKPT